MIAALIFSLVLNVALLVVNRMSMKHAEESLRLLCSSVTTINELEKRLEPFKAYDGGPRC